MNRPLLSILTLAGVAAGFAVGWLTGADAMSGQASGERSASAVSKTSAPPPGVAPVTEFPELASVADCQEFLSLADSRYKDRHPFLLQSVRDYALRRWLELDAESALTEAERLPGEEYGKRGFANDLFRVWLDLDVTSAVSAWHQASPVLARAVRFSFLKAMAEKDGSAALAECKASRAAKAFSWDEAENEVFRVWAKYDPRAATEMSFNSQASRDVISEWIKSDPAAAAEWIRSRDDKEKFFPPLLPWLLKTDPAAAAEALEGPKAGKASDYAIQNAAREWAQKDPLDALRWAESEPMDGLMVREVLGAAARKIAYADPLHAMEILQRLQQSTPARPTEDRTLQAMEISGAWREIFASVAATDSARARELVMSQPQDSRRNALDGYFTYTFAADPDAAIAQCREWMADPAMKDTVLSAFTDSFRWGHGAGTRDPSAALASLPEFANRIDADVLSGWAKMNPRGAAEWIAQRTASGNPVEGLKDEGVIADIAISEPVWTATWLRTLVDASLQNEAANTLAANWGAFDPDAAQEWMESLPEGPLRTAAETGFNRRNGK